MIDIQEALSQVLESSQNYGQEKVPLMESVGRFLAEDIHTDRDAPPFDRVTMDGIAIQLGDLENQPLGSYPIQGIQAAGLPQMTLENRKHCIEVMTGAIMPKNADTVIPYEEVEIQDGQAKINLEKIAKRNIHYRGSDSRQGEKIIANGKKINAADIGVLATVGKITVKVSNLPDVAIISTGDELVNVDETPQEHQIRKSNVYSLWAGLMKDGIKPEMFHITDDKTELEDKLKGLLKDFDVLLLSGGVSKGKYDMIPEVLDDLGVQKSFHRVAQKPGKPFWFGFHKELNSKVFAFPGNPLATYVGYQFYFRQWLHQSLGEKLQFNVCTLGKSLPGNPKISQFVPVQINKKNGEAMPIKNNGSGDLFSLSQTEAFLLVPRREGENQAGEKFQLIEMS
ncbi:molybdopterin molybdotransferase MoeA [Echinicola jeungdonensis]|uniref:Molybdopterin molybdenumtransferase n=1 Tax=Echinicola jeungdonensis TaxID=709343 RepID=A0ABV5J7T7_9BACT|nr:molybdopterin molybdotransferase MoeA [Echinicola jeungdonensis]MDN3669648.1 molybdopterin molybdotransferase MoeA [Echinicola jeungdonensis]